MGRNDPGGSRNSKKMTLSHAIENYTSKKNINESFPTIQISRQTNTYAKVIQV